MDHFQLIMLTAVLAQIGEQCNIPKPLLLLQSVSFLLFSFYMIIYLGCFSEKTERFYIKFS